MLLFCVNFSLFAYGQTFNICAESFVLFLPVIYAAYFIKKEERLIIFHLCLFLLFPKLSFQTINTRFGTLRREA